MNTNTIPNEEGASLQPSSGRLLDVRPEALNKIEQSTFGAVAALSRPEQIELLRGTAGEREEPFRFTVWRGGVWDTREGVCGAMSAADLAHEMETYGANAVAKGEGAWFAGAITRNGRARDCDASHVTMLSLDADSGGDWHEGLAKLQLAGVGFVAQRSSSHRPEWPKFHLHIAFAELWSGEKPEWRQTFRGFLGVFNAIFGFRAPEQSFDRSTHRLVQPIFLGTRRGPDDPVPEVQWSAGCALDGQRLLDAVAFAPVYKDGPRPRRRRQSRGAPQRLTSQVQGVLALAFDYAGMAGGIANAGAVKVVCPWQDLHTSGQPLNGSTVVFPPRAPGGLGWFHCRHEHCRDRTQEDVLRALPPSALGAALRNGGRP